MRINSNRTIQDEAEREALPAPVRAERLLAAPMSRRSLVARVAALAAFVPAAGALTACGATGSAGSSKPGNATSTTELVLWHYLTEGQQAGLQAVADGFNASQDEFKVTLKLQPTSEYNTKLMQAVRAKTGPDIAILTPAKLVDYIDAKLVQNLEEFVDDREIGIDDLKGDLPAGIWDEMRQFGDENLYYLPVSATGEVFYYNKTIYDKLGLSAPSTWDELAENCKKIHEAEKIPGFGTDSATSTFIAMISQAGSGYIDTRNKKLAIDEKIGKEKLRWFADGVQAGYFRLVGEDQYFSNPFGSQSVGSYIGSSAGAGFVAGAVGDKFAMDVAPIPQQGSERFVNQWSFDLLSLSTDRERARGCYLFMKYMRSGQTVVDWAKAYGAVPVSESALQLDTFKEYAAGSAEISALQSEMPYAGYQPAVKGSQTVLDEMDKMIQNVCLGKQDVDGAWDAFVQAADAALQK